MIIMTYEYAGYLVEVHEHPIYHDFEFVIKTKDLKQVKGASNRIYVDIEELKLESYEMINQL